MLSQNRLSFCALASVVLFALSANYALAQSTTWTATFEPANQTIHMNEQATINLTITGLDANKLRNENATIEIRSDSQIAGVYHPIPLNDIVDGTWKGAFQIDAIFLGSAKIYVAIESVKGEDRSTTTLPVIIIREERFIDKLFVISVASLVSILYINFGAAIDLTKVKAILIRPVGPAIACFCQFVFLPLVSFRFWCLRLSLH